MSSELPINIIKENDICTQTLTDIEFIKHMIDHHQVAIDMSHILYNYTKNPQLTYLARNIIFS
jgi:uncharacterized protein (DUF305 family)